MLEQFFNFFINTDVIYGIDITDEQVVISYRHKKIIIKIAGPLTDFNFRKKIDPGDKNSPEMIYLEIYYKSRLFLKQSVTSKWSEQIFDDIILSFKKNFFTKTRRFNFNYKSNSSYNLRLRQSFIKRLLIFGGIYLFYVLASKGEAWLNSLVVLSIIFLITYFYSQSLHKYMIYYMDITDDYVLIKYQEKREHKRIKGRLEDFSFKKKGRRYEEIWMNIYIHAMPVLHQNAIGPWTEDLFDDIIFCTQLLKGQ